MRNSALPLDERHTGEASERQRRHLTGQNHALVREHNRCAILRSLLSHGPTSRSRLTKLTGLQPATVSSLTSELIDQRVICEVGVTAVGGMGRPTIDLDFAPGGTYAIGVHIGVRWIAIGLVSPRGAVSALAQIPRPPIEKPAATLSLVIESIRGVLARTAVPLDRVVGIGIGMPAIVDPDDGRIVAAVDIGWHDVPIVAPFQSAFDLSVIVANNAQAMALAESWFGTNRDTSDLALIYVASTVSAGLVIDGRLLRGASWGAGQIGHSRTRAPNDARCSCGNFGCLETVISQQSLVRDAIEAGVPLPPDDETEYMPEGFRIDALIQAGLAGDSAAAAVLSRAGEHLGGAVANLINLVNPPLIVLAGHLALAGDLVIAPMRESAASSALPVLVRGTRFEPSALGVNGLVVGPAALALVDCFYVHEQVLHR